MAKYICDIMMLVSLRSSAPVLHVQSWSNHRFAQGRGQYLFDENGKEYLDCVNNVCTVGHCHPKVVKAIQVECFCHAYTLLLFTVRTGPSCGAQHQQPLPPRRLCAGMPHRRHFQCVESNDCVQYAIELTSMLPEPLSVVVLVNSGSEANELAIRMAKAYTRMSLPQSWRQPESCSLCRPEGPADHRRLVLWHNQHAGRHQVSFFDRSVLGVR